MDPASLVTVTLVLGSGPSGDYAAVQYQVAPEWHIYWENSGDTGMPTTVQLDAPEGVTLGEPVWSVPHALERPGDLIDYAYEDRALLLFPVTGDASALEGSTRYLVCRADTCIAGKQALTVAEQGSAEGWLELLPAPMPADRVARSKRKVEIAVPGATAVQAFPDLALAESAKPPELRDGHVIVSVDPDVHGTLLLRVTVDGQQELWQVEL